MIGLDFSGNVDSITRLGEWLRLYFWGLKVDWLGD